LLTVSILFLGNLITNVVPSLSLDFTSRMPLCFSIIVLQKANPNPVPLYSLVVCRRTNGSNIFD